MIDLIRLFRCLTPWRDNFVYQSSRQVAACLRELGCGAGVPRSGGKQAARGPRVYRSILRTIPAGGRPASPGGIMRMLLPILVGILTVACGDGDTSVSSPVEPTPPPTPPLTATMAPSSGAVVAGNSVVFAVNTSGGATGESASWTCASSNPGIATASNTTAGCQATGVAAGDVTITATVTKGGESINVASQLTVTPPPPLVATMSPDAQTIGVGGTVVFAVSVSGGAAGEAASWTCASSDPSKATVSTTPAGCQATALAAGGVTITAAVTKGGETVNTGARLTILEDMAEPAFVALASITDETPNDNTLSGRVSVRVNVERGDQFLERLSLLVDEDEVACLSFGGGICSSRRDGHLLHRRLMPQQTAQAGVHLFTLTFDSSGYNGYHTISVQLYTRGADEALSSGVHSVEFANMPDPPDPPPAGVGTRANPAAVGDTIKYETDFFHFDGVGTLEITLRGVAEGDSAMAIIERDFSDVRNIAGTHYVYVVADFRIKVLEQTNPDRPITIPLSWPNWTSWSGDTWYPYPYVITQGGGKPVATGTEWVARVPLIFHRERSTVLDDLAAYQYHPEAERRRGPDHGAWFIIRERLAP